MGSNVRGRYGAAQRGLLWRSVQPAHGSLINAEVWAKEVELDTRHHWGLMSVTE